MLVCFVVSVGEGQYREELIQNVIVFVARFGMCNIERKGY